MSKVSANGLNLIKLFEGFKLTAYLDSVRVPTIGFGTTVYPDGTKVTIGDKISEQQALDYLKNHLNKSVIPYIDNYVKVPINQNQIDALASLIYNIGGPAFKGSTLLKKINAKDTIDNIGVSWLGWNKAGGKVLGGLVRRRNEELKLYKS